MCTYNICIIVIKITVTKHKLYLQIFISSRNPLTFHLRYELLKQCSRTTSTTLVQEIFALHWPDELARYSVLVCKHIFFVTISQLVQWNWDRMLNVNCIKYTLNYYNVWLLIEYTYNTLYIEYMKLLHYTKKVLHFKQHCLYSTCNMTSSRVYSRVEMFD